MKNVPDAFAAPPNREMSRLPRTIGTGSVSAVPRAVQSRNRPSTRIPGGTTT